MCFSLLDEMNYALIQYMFPDNIEQPLSPKKRKGKPFIPTAPSVKNFRKNQETVDNGPSTSAAQHSNILSQTVGGK